MKHRLSAGRWPIASLCLSLSLILLLAACGGEASTPTTQTITVAAPADTYLLEPNKGNVAQYPVNARVFETLVTMSPSYEVQPLLAERWEFIEPNTWRFHLRQGVKFHDGTELTAEAVQWTMKRIAGRGGGILGVDENSVKIIDDLTVDITPAKPNLRLVQQLTHPQNSIVARGTDPATERVGTGPFKVVEYVKDDHLTVERFDGYWGPKAQPLRVTFRFIPDPNTRVLALEAGEVQVAYDILREVAGDVDAKPGLGVVHSGVGASVWMLACIHCEAPYDLGQDPAVREAIAYAIDKEALVNQVWEGNAATNPTAAPPSILGNFANLVKGTSFNPERVRQVLDAAGWTLGPDGIREKEGRRLSLVLLPRPPDEVEPLPEFIQAQLKAVGIEVQIERVSDAATYTDRIDAGEGDLWVELVNQNDANPCFLPDLRFYSKSNVHSAFRFAPGPEFDAVIEGGCRTGITIEAVQEAAAEAERIVIDREHIVVPLAGVFRLWGVSDDLTGFVAHPSTLYTNWESLALK